ncbi:MAG: hypothetical protein Q8787_02520, partial [Sweet potato little leaf phytoplasma]|nr:hypothetical protein [Sweet potato little leaf phytoplasma]
MISSPSAQIVNAIAEKTLIKIDNGDSVPAYGPVMGVATAIIAIGIAVTTAFGPEKRGRHFEAAKVAGAVEEPVKDVEAGFGSFASQGGKGGPKDAGAEKIEMAENTSPVDESKTDNKEVKV